ncbi:transposable element Tcb2 transposase [Trichonephila clavipes]|nr:transposable element Tcb2 transposase [Trichonephila clavipes]
MAAAQWNQVVLSDETRFNLSSDDNRVRAWRHRVERLNPAFALQRCTTPTAGVMLWWAIAYNTRSPIVLIRGTMAGQWYSMTFCNHICCHHAMAHRSHFSIRQCSVSHSKDVTRLSLYSYYPSLVSRSPDLSPIERTWDNLGR